MSIASDYSTVFQDDSETLNIAVMGPTGTGKTSFINLLSGSSLRVGSELESCTSQVEVSGPFVLDGHTICLIDTPGFDDTNLSDTKVLNMIAAYLSLTHARGKRLAGVIYMHRILDNRLGGISARNFRLFRNLCGDDSLSKIIIATTMWDSIQESLGDEREKELVSKEVFFKTAVEKGCRVMRHYNTIDSAQAIVRSILQQGTPTVTLQIQEELGRGLDISETRAGKELGQEICEQMERHREEIRGLMVEIQETVRTRDEEARKELTEERAKMESVLTRLQDDSANLTRGYHEALLKMEERLRQAQAETTARKRMSKCDGDFPEGGHGGMRPECPTGGQQTHSPIVQAVAATENSNAVLEGKLAAAIPIVGFWGLLCMKEVFFPMPFGLVYCSFGNGPAVDSESRVREPTSRTIV